MDKIKTLAGVAMVLLVAGWTQAASFRPLPEQEQVNLGATHVLTMTYADFTETTTNTAQTFTNVFAVSAKEGVQLVAMQLKTAYDTGNTNYTGSCAVTVGDGADADLYLTSTELASDGTEVFLKFGRTPLACSTATTYLTNTITYLGATTNLLTNTIVYASSVTETATDDSYGRKVYTADDQIEIVFTPNAEEALAANTSGEVRFYFKITR